MELGPGEAEGAPDHPHRGFETVTYLLDGEFVHADSQGNTGALAARRRAVDDGRRRRGALGDAVGEDPPRGRARARVSALGEPAARRQADAAALSGRQGGVDPGRPKAKTARCACASSPARRWQARGHRHAHADLLPALLARAGGAARAAGAAAITTFRLCAQRRGRARRAAACTRGRWRSSAGDTVELRGERAGRAPAARRQAARRAGGALWAVRHEHARRSSIEAFDDFRAGRMGAIACRNRTAITRTFAVIWCFMR